MEKQVESCIGDAVSFEALMVARCYLYELFHKVFGGEPDARLLRIIASDATADALDEYAYDDVTMARLLSFVEHVGERIDDRDYLDAAKDEFALFFEGPLPSPAHPWESPYVGERDMVLQENVLGVRDAYAVQGLRAKRYGHVPDDHVSLMCAFMAQTAKRSLNSMRAGNVDSLKMQLNGQFAFVHEHMANWLPRFARNARRVEHPRLYPQLAQGVAAFTVLDEGFIAQALAWFDELGADAPRTLCQPGYDREALFGNEERALCDLNFLRLRGLEDNELVAVLQKA